jgi:uncharacterized phiE125 gp8 family phage protein
MILYSRVTEHPDSEPISLDEAKTHLEYTGSSKDSYITTLIKVARRICEAYSGLSFITQERAVKLDYFPLFGRFIQLPYGPVQSMLSFSYTDTDGNTVNLTEGVDYVVNYHQSPARVYALKDGEIDTWPSNLKRIPSCVIISYQAGYDDISGEPLPEEAKQAMLLQIATMFENRQNEQTGMISHKIHLNAETLLDNIKVSWNANID